MKDALTEDPISNVPTQATLGRAHPGVESPFLDVCALNRVFGHYEIGSPGNTNPKRSTSPGTLLGSISSS